MKKRFLGIICILYSSIIFYIFIKESLKNFLAPNMQKYILIAMPIMLLIGIVIIFTKENNYKFKLSDLILILPLIMILIAPEGKLSTNIAKNRSNTFRKEVKEKKQDKKVIDKKEEINDSDQYNFENIDYIVRDDSYQMLSDLITYNSKPDKLVGKTIRVRGFTLMKDEAIPKGYFGFGKYLITCCAADAGFGGFFAKYDNLSKIKANTWYEIEGILRKGKDGYKNEILYIDVKNIKKINKDKEELYVYPCYSYGDGECKVLNEYDIEP